VDDSRAMHEAPSSRAHSLGPRRGQGIVEYALVLLFVAITIVAGLTLLGERTPAPIENVTEVFDQGGG
jgi:Flp pilus assembly pilin Flp